MSERKLKDIYPLTPVQEGMLFHHLYEPESGLYVEQLTVDIDGGIDIPSFFLAVQRTVNRHAVLKSCFQWEGLKKPMQVELDAVAVPTELLDRRGAAHRRADEAAAYARAEREKGFDLGSAPLLRVGVLDFGADDYHLVWTFHHLILDGWSLGVSLGEIFTLYDEELSGGVAKLPPPVPFKNHILWMKNRNEADARAYWSGVLAGLEKPTLLFDGRPVEVEGDPHRTRILAFSREETERLSAFAQNCKVTINTLLQAALALIVSSAAREYDVVFGSTVNGRPMDLRGFESMVGMFINTVPCRVRIDPAEHVGDFLRRIQQDQSSRSPYEYYALTEIQKLCPFAVQAALFDAILVFENYPLDDGAFTRDDFRMKNLRTSERTNYPLTIVAGKADILKLTFFSDARVVRTALLDFIVSGFRNALANLVDPAARVDSIELTDGAQRERVLTVFNATRAPFPSTTTLTSLFEDRVRATPDAVAVSDGTRMLTYREFDAASDALAGLLRERGVGPDRVAAVCAERSIELVVALYAVLKAGGAYLPIDPAYPADRVAFLLQDSGAVVALADAAGSAAIGTSAVPLLRLDQEYAGAGAAADAAATARTAGADNLAYIIYTSGSTGNPKGVMIEHRSAVNILTQLQSRYPLTVGDAYLFKTTFTFDVSVTELFGWFFAGGRLEILEKGGEKDPLSISRAIVDRGVTHVNFVPSMLTIFLQRLAEEGEAGKSALSSLKFLFVAGEALTPDLVERIGAFRRSGAADDGFVLANLYGPTETTIYASGETIPAGPAPNPVPIGRPVDNGTAYILDRDGRLLPPGVSGELCVGGVPVARGYLNRPELNAEKFVADPFRPRARMYRTGDLCAWREDGRIDYLGRIDFQVKIRGFRIELGEVEDALRRHDAIDDAVVVAHREKDGAFSLCAYYAGADEMPVARLRAFLGERLPDYMLPSYFIHLERLPTTASGKVDRKALPSPRAAATASTAFRNPEGETETALAAVWQECLDLARVGAGDNFFEVGGDSLKAIKLTSKLRAAGFAVEIKDLFTYQTIAELASFLARGTEGARVSFAEIEARVAERLDLSVRLARYAVEGEERIVLFHEAARRADLEMLLSSEFPASVFPHYMVAVAALPDVGTAAAADILPLERSAFDRLVKAASPAPDLDRVRAAMSAAERRVRDFLARAPVVDRYELSPIQYMQRRLPLRASGTILKVDGYALIERLGDALRAFVNRHGQLRAVLERRGFKLVWKEYGALSAIDLPTVDLSSCAADVQDAVVRTLVNEYFKKPHELTRCFAYRFLLIRLNLREAYLVFPADHMVYERRCEDLLAAHLADYASAPDAQPPAVAPYGEYARSLRRGPRVSAAALIERYGFRDFGDARLALEKRIKALRNGQANVFVKTLEFPEELDEQRAWKASFLFAVHFLRGSLGLERIPFKVLAGARVIGDRNYFNTFGEFVDAVPFLADAGAEDLRGILESYQRVMDQAADDRLNVLTLLLSPSFRVKYGTALKFILPKILGLFDSLLLFNFSGKVNPLVERFLEKANYKKAVADLIKSASIYIGAGYDARKLTVTIYSSIPFSAENAAASEAYVRGLEGL